VPEKDIEEERRRALEREGGDFSGGFILGLVYSALLFFMKLIAGSLLTEGLFEAIGVASIAILSWLSRVFYASVVFIASYISAGVIASLVFYYYESSPVLLYSFLLGSLLGYLISILEVSIFPKRNRDELLYKNMEKTNAEEGNPAGKLRNYEQMRAFRHGKVSLN